MRNEYHFITRWEIPAGPEEIYRVLEDIDALKRWWPSVYLDTQVLEPGQPGGVGKVIALYTKGWLPYTLRWTFRVTAADFPNGFSLDAFGDFVGKGVWHFEPIPGTNRSEVTYDWRIAAQKPLLRKLSFLLRPVFSWNHHWAMRQGKISLELELQRRHAQSEAARNRIPAPPGPVFPHNLTNNRVFQPTPA